MFEYKGERYTLADLQEDAKNQGFVNFDEYMELYIADGMREIPNTSKGPVSFEERDALDILKSKAANFAKMPVNALDNFIQIYETGEYPGTYEDSFFGNIMESVGEVVAEGPVEASLGYAAKYLRDKGYDIPDEYFVWDLTTPEERREKFENFLLDVRKDPDMTLEMARRLDPTNKIKFENAIEWLNKYTYIYKDENGNPLDYLDLFEQGEILAGLDAFTDDLSAGIPSLIISRAPYGAGAAFLGASSYMENFETDLFERGIDEETTRADIMNNSLITGAADMAMEFAGGRIINGLVKRGVKKKTAEEILTQMPKVMLKKFGLGFASEFVTEGATGVLQQAANEWTYDDVSTYKSYARTFLKDGMIGGFLGGPAVVISTPNKKQVYEYVSPKAWRQEQLKIEENIIRLMRDSKKSRGKEKEIIENKIKELQDQKKKNKENLYSFFDSLTDLEKKEYAQNIDKQHEQLDIIGNSKYDNATQAQAKKDLEKYTEANNKFFGSVDIDYDATLEQILGRTLKASERIQQQKKVFGFNKKKLNIEYVDSDSRLEELNKEFEGFNMADGMFYAEDKSGKPTIYINTKIAGLAEQTNALGHEYLHAIVSRSFSEGIGAANLKGAVSSFVEYLKDTGQQNIVNRIEERLANKYKGRDKNGNIIRDANGLVKTEKLKDQEEYFNLFSDLIKKEKIELVEGKSKGIINSMRALHRGLGFGNVDYQNGQEVFNWLVDYNTNMQRAGILGKITSRGLGRVKLKGLEAKIDPKTGESDVIKEDVKKSVTKKDLTPKQVTDRINKLGRVDKDGNDLQEEGIGNFYYQAEVEDIYKTIQEEGLLDNLILKQPHVGVNDQAFLDTTYAELFSWVKKYEPERKNPSGLFGHINSQIPNRAKQAYNAITKGQVTAPTVDIGQTTKEGEVKVQVAAEKSTEMEAFEQEDISPAARAKKKAEKAKTKEKVESKFRRKLGIQTGGDLYNKVLDSSRKALLRAYETGVSVRNIQRKLRDEANVYLFKEIKNFLGTKKYISNLKEFRVSIMEAIFTADLVQMERNVPESEKVFTKFVRKLTSKEEVQAAVDQNLLPASALNIIDKGTAVNLYEKVIPTEKQFLSFFDIPTINPVTGIRSGKRGTRKDTLAKQIAGALSYDATMEVAQEPTVIKKRQDIAELKGESLPQDNLERLAEAIGRDPNVKFSKSTLTDSKREKAALYLQAKENSLPIGHPAKPFFELTRQLVEEGHDIVDVWTIAMEQFGIDSNVLNLILQDGDLSRSHIDNVIWAINNFVVAKIRKLGHDASKKYLKKQLDKAKNITEKINIVNEYLANIGRPVRSAGVDSITTNQKLYDDVIVPLGLGDYYRLVDANIRGKKIQFRRNKKTEKFEDVELYENIENIKNNAYKNNDLIQQVNKQALKAQEYIFKILDSKLTNSEKKAIVQLMAYDQRGALRKSFKLGMVVDRSSKNGKKYNSKNTILEHEYTIKDLQDNLNDYIDGKPQKLEKIFEESRVHVLPKTIDNILSREGLRHRGSFTRYDNAKFKKALQKLIDDKVVKNVPAKFSKSIDLQKLNNAVMFSRSTNNESKGITVLDFDDTLATTQSLVKFTRPDGTTGALNAEQYASTYETLLSKGYKFDFSEFNKVVKGKIAPLFQKALKLQNKFGPENMFVLTARPPAAANAIHKFLKANGLNIPLKNITGLANSTAEAKALWIADKVSEGYNDFYFADDALQNVKAVANMLDQFDVKSKVQQAKVKFSKSMDKDFNDILEDVTSIESKKRFSAVKARKRGEKKGRFRLFIPPSHEDFVGLLYNFIGKGKKGNTHRDFFEKALIRPLNRAYRELNTAKQSIANDYKTLNKQFPDIKKKLTKKTPDGDFTYQDAIRIYLWNKHGHNIPGLSKTDQQALVDLVMNDAELRQYAEILNTISKQSDYVKPTDSWEGGDIRIDLDDATGRVGRAEFFAEFFENADIIFSQENLNKIEAAYGPDMVSALKDILYRTKTGRNRPSGQNALVNKFLNYLNGSVASTMFFNMRSAVLQQMSIVNFINYSDNNIFAAAKAFANQKQYWTDWATIFNSDFMKQRRAGIKTDVNGAELAASVKNATNPIQAAIKKMLELGFSLTQIGDNFAIATGGATYYRNRINTYLKKGLSQKEAEAKAFVDFQALAEATQQSARPDMVSQQQASPLGKVILAFQNVTSQFNRLGKKAFLDLKNRRISPEYKTASNPQLQSDVSNVSRIAYYFAIQNLIFYALQSALFMAMFDDDEEDEKLLKKKERMINGSIDSVLRGSGVMGGVIATLKNMAIKWYEQRDKNYNADESAVLMEMLNVSPPLGIKARKIVNAEKTLNYNKKIIDEMETFDIDNPQWSAVTNYIEATTNVPLNRMYNKTQNVRESLNNQHSAFERALMFSGWSKWNLGIEDSEKIKEVKEKVKKKKGKKKIKYLTLPTL